MTWLIPKQLRMFQWLTNRMHLTVLIPTVVVATVWCAIQHQDVVVTRDEAFTWRLVSGSVLEAILATSRDVHPPLYYLSIHWAGMLNPGGDISVLRWFSALLAMVSVFIALWIVAQTVCRLAPDRQGSVAPHIATACLMVASPMHMAAGGNARMYALGTLLTLAATAAVFWWLQQPQSRYRFLTYVASATLLAYTHYFGVLAVAGQLSGLAFVLLIERRSLKPVLAATGTIGLLWSPWLPTFLWQFSEVRGGYWIPIPTDGQLADFLLTWLAGCTDEANIPLLVVLAAIFILGFWQCRQYFCPVLIGQILVPWWVCLAVIELYDRSILQLRYLVFAHAALAVQTALLVGGLKWKSLRVAAVAALVCTLVPAAAGYLQHLRGRTDGPLAEAFAYVRRHMRSDEYIRVSWYGELNRTRYYAMRAGIPGDQVRCKAPAGRPDGHVVHAASLVPADFVQRGDEQRAFWTVEISTDRNIAEAPIRTVGFQLCSSACTVLRHVPPEKSRGHDDSHEVSPSHGSQMPPVPESTEGIGGELLRDRK